MKTKYVIFLFTFLNVSVALAQNYYPGKIVTNQGDTLRGYLQYREGQLSPQTISFRSTQEGTTTTYTASDIGYVAYKGGDAFRSYPVSVSMDGIDLHFAPNVPTPPGF